MLTRSLMREDTRRVLRELIDLDAALFTALSRLYGPNADTARVEVELQHVRIRIGNLQHFLAAQLSAGTPLDGPVPALGESQPFVVDRGQPVDHHQMTGG